MSFASLVPWIWGQVEVPVAPARTPAWLQWLFLFGEPSITLENAWGGPLTWLKIVGLIALFCWVGSWILSGFKERVIRGPLPMILLAVAAVLGLTTVTIGTLQALQRLGTIEVGGISLPLLLGLAALIAGILWVELLLWPSILRLGKTADVLTLIGIHIGLILGFVVAALLAGGRIDPAGVIGGARLGSTFMGYAVLLRVAGLLIAELFALRPRRVHALAWHSVVEATRKMWAPWVVLVLFVVVLAFTHWFLDPPRAELGRMYVGTLMLFISLVLTAMVVILTPISLPNDIQQQTIYTVVSKPVRRLEMVWGRVLGYMALVTVLLAIFGIGSAFYIYRQVESEIRLTEAALTKARGLNQREQSQQLENQLAQLRARYSARVPVKGSLMFEDSVGKKTPKGIDVGQELEYRSFVEGATPSRAIWRFGVVQDPFDELFPDPKRPQRPLLDRRIPVESLLRTNSIEWLENQAAELAYEAAELKQRIDNNQAPATESTRLTRLNQERQEFEERAGRLRAQEADLRAREKAAEAAGNGAEAAELRRQADALHSDPVTVQMTFNVYRTTKGAVGEPVYASIRVLDFLSERPVRVVGSSDVIPIREYYTNTWTFPASALVGSRGYLKIEVKCISPTQYLGMAESDLYILAKSGNFWVNYAKGLFGVWLQAMVLTAVGVWAGTYLSWPVALLLTIFFFMFGQIAYSFLQAIAVQSLLGGGPFESFIRMIGHNNQMTDLDPTVPVVVAKTLDAIVMPVLSRLVYIIPNLTGLDVSTKVADGFAVDLVDIRDKLLMALGYALPFSVAGYFILKQREVAA